MASKVNTKVTEKKPGVWKSFFLLMTSVKVPWGWVALATLSALFGAQLSLLIPDATAKVVAGDVSMSAILFMVACMFLSALQTSIRQIFGRIASSKTEMNFQKLMLKKNLSLPMPFFDKNMANRLITRTTSDSTLIAEFFGWSIPYIPASIYQFVGTLAILSSYNWRLVMLMAIMLPILFGVTFLNGRVQFTWNNRIQGKVSELGSYLAEALANIPLIKIFVKEKVEEEKGKEVIQGIYATKKKFLYFGSIVGFLSSTENIIQTMVVVLGGATLVNGGYINLEQWIAFLTEEQVREKYLEKSRPFFRSMVVYAGVAQALSGQDAETIFQAGLKEMAARSNMDVETMLEKFQISDAAARNQVFFNKAEEMLKERCEQLMEE